MNNKETNLDGEMPRALKLELGVIRNRGRELKGQDFKKGEAGRESKTGVEKKQRQSHSPLQEQSF